MRCVGFLVNPIAGMGGRVGLKGTDDKVDEAIARGAQAQAPERAKRALVALDAMDTNVALASWGEPMGASIAEAVGFSVDILGEPVDPTTSVEDTIAAVRAFLAHEVDVILFAGGDGTAVDIVEVLESANAATPILGIPAGVKMFSSVFAVTPEAAGRTVATFRRTELREVADLDEEAYRAGEIKSSLRGVVHVPIADTLQAGKQLAGGSIEGLVEGIVASMEPDRPYFLGPGSTVGAVKEALEIDGTPLGIDVVRDGTLHCADATESDLLQYLENDPVIVISPIGGQGFVFGRGNQPFSPRVIRKAEIEIVASREKLEETGVLRVDTGDRELDEALRGWTKVRVGRVERRMIEIV